MADEPIAASSAVAETPVAPESPVLPNLSGMSSAQVAEWRKTGEAPKANDSDTPADQPVEQVASTEVAATPASEPGSPKKKNAESRKQELQAEIDGLLKTRAQLRAEVSAPVPVSRPDVQPAVSSPAAAFPDYDTWSTQQPAGSDIRYEVYSAEFTLDVAARKQHAYADQQARAEAAREATELQTAYRHAAETFVTDHPDYWSVVNPITQHLPVQNATTEAMGDVIARSASPPQLLYHLGTHKDEFQRILSLPPARAVYELGKIDASLTPSSVPSVPRTSAPPPPQTLSTRAVAPVDDVDAALASGDFRRYKAAQNARDVAAHR
jgi:hypothetical protein